MNSVRSSRKPILLLAAALCLLVVGLVIWQQGQPEKQRDPVVEADPFARLNFDDPQPSYLMLRYVCERGGDDSTRRLAISWLDEQTRSRLALPADRHQWLLEMAQSGGHPDWDIEARLWILNSAFNVLQLGRPDEQFSGLLMKLATEHPHKTMRLYALQHLDALRSIGKLTGSHAEEVRATLIEIANDPSSEVAGTALTTLITWNGPDRQPGPELIELALQFAADNERPDDIRATALHASGEDGLPLSRRLSTDLDQPIHIRKAAIACIGKHGGEEDIATLVQLEGEHFRITQATTPALKAIRHRATNPPPRQLISF